MDNVIKISVTDGNATPAVRAALDMVKADCKNRIEFEKGTYRFYKEGALRDMFFVSNNKSCEKDVIFPVIDKNNVEICGNGSEFVFCGRVTPFVIQNSNDVKLRDFVIDFSFPRHFEGYVKNIDDVGFEITVDRSVYNYEVKNGNVYFDAGEDVLSTADRKLFVVDKTVDTQVAYLFVGDSTESRENLAAKAMYTDAFQTDEGIYFKFRDGSVKIPYRAGDRLLISNDENRENSVIFAEGSNGIALDNITVYRGAGMGFIAQMCEDIDINKFVVKPRDGRDDLLSVTADAIHIVHCSGDLTVRNCEIIKSVDDAVNIHGAYARVNELLSADKIKVGFCHAEQSGIVPYRAGDRVHINDGETLTERETAVISAVDFENDRDSITLTFSEDITDKIHVGDFLENPDRMPRVYIAHNVMRNCPHIRISSSQKTVFEDNVFDFIHEDILVNDLFKYWYESGAVGEIEIRNNTFVGSFDSHNIVITTGRGENTNRLHRRIVIENNTFNKPESAAIKAKYVEELVVNNNIFNI